MLSRRLGSTRPQWSPRKVFTVSYVTNMSARSICGEAFRPAVIVHNPTYSFRPRQSDAQPVRSLVPVNQQTMHCQSQVNVPAFKHSGQSADLWLCPVCPAGSLFQASATSPPQREHASYAQVPYHLGAGELSLEEGSEPGVCSATGWASRWMDRPWLSLCLAGIPLERRGGGRTGVGQGK